MKKTITMLASAVLLASGSLQAQQQVPELDGLDTFVQEAMSYDHTPGVAVAVVRGDEVVYSKGFGVREAGKRGAVDGDTLFAIGSNSKYFTATAVGLLVDEGKLDWDAPLTTYLPNLRFSDPYLFTEVTLRDALAHRSGLGRDDMAWYAQPDLTRDEVLAMIEHLPREIGFRSGFLYNNFMYLAAGETIPAVSGDSWDEVIEERFFEPLKMSRSLAGVGELAGKKNVAQPHTVVDGESVVRPYLNIDHVGPAGSILSSVNDMAQWCKAQLADGKLGDKQVIPAAVIDEVRKPHNLLPLAKEGYSGTEHASYALGVGRRNHAAHTRYHHTGGIDGMLSSFTFFPEQQLCVVALTNNDSSSLFTAVGNWVVDHMLAMAPADKDYLAEFKESTDKAKAKAAAEKEAYQSAADASVTSSLPLADFAGKYASDLYGEMVVSHDADGLRVQYGSVFVGTLKHHRGDNFQVMFDPASGRHDHVDMTFSVNGLGKVESVEVNIINRDRERFIAQPDSDKKGQ